MPSGKFVFRLAFSLLCLSVIASGAYAQYRASLRGTVIDSQSNAVSGATVTLTNKDTGATQVSTSDANGIYEFNALPVAAYRLTAEHAGFKKKVLEQVQIISEQANSLDLPLEVGAVQETVTVTDTTQALEQPT